MLDYDKVQKIKKYLKFIFIDPFQLLFVKIYAAILLLLDLGVFFLANFTYRQVVGKNIALHYSVDFGIDFYGASEKIFIIPILAVFFSLLNFSAAFVLRLYLKNDFRFLAHVLLSVAILISLVLLGSAISIYLVNFR